VPAAVGLAGVLGAATTRAAGGNTTDRAQLHPRIVDAVPRAVYSLAVLGVRGRPHGSSVRRPQEMGKGPSCVRPGIDAERLGVGAWLYEMSGQVKGVAVKLRMVTGGAIFGVLAAFVMAAQPSPSLADTSGDALYRLLEQRAAAGDRRAEEMVAALDRYLVAKGLQVADLGPARNQVTTARSGPVALRIRDLSPWAITVENVSTFSARSDLDAYVAVRTAALVATVRANPRATVEARLAPSELVGVGEFLRNLSCDCEGRSLVVDVFSGDRWLMTSMRPLGDEGLDADRVVADLREQALASIDQFPGIDRADIRFTVRSVTIETTAASAQELADRPGMLLVDVTNDLKTAYEGKAAFVEVRGGPDVFGAYAQFALDNVFERTRLNPDKQAAER
jgi:hypothetical protein